MAATDFFNEGQRYNVIDSVLQAITQRESGGEEDPYNVIAGSGARGKYQFMPSTFEKLRNNTVLTARTGRHRIKRQ